MSVDFKDFYSIEDYREMVEGNSPDKWDGYSKAIIQFLKSKAKNGELEMPSNGHTHNSNTMEAWSQLVKNCLKPHNENLLDSMFLYIAISNATIHNKTNSSHKGEYKNAVSYEEGYKELTDKISKGDFRKHEVSPMSECSCCGKPMLVTADNWTIKLFTNRLDDGKHVFAPLPECIEDKKYEVKVEFKTGELLMADWFRIPEFTEKVGYNKDYTELSINFALGAIKSTEQAAKFGFVTIHVGNSSPYVFQNGEDFVFGHERESMKNDEYKESGTICTDLWNATIIDKSRLIEIIAEKLGTEKASETVEEYLEELGDDVSRITVSPGTYTVSYSPLKDVEEFDKDLPKEIEVIFSMKKDLPQKKLKM